MQKPLNPCDNVIIGQGHTGEHQNVVATDTTGRNDISPQWFIFQQLVYTKGVSGSVYM